MSEDCLSMILYIPGNLNVQGGASILMWYEGTSYNFKDLSDYLHISRVHGGSFIGGSATNPGLDGSNLAIATNSIVAVVQYRLGAVSPDSAYSVGQLIYFWSSSASWDPMGLLISDSRTLLRHFNSYKEFRQASEGLPPRLPLLARAAERT